MEGNRYQQKAEALLQEFPADAEKRAADAAKQAEREAARVQRDVLDKATERTQILSARARELNNTIVQGGAKARADRDALLDEEIDGNPPELDSALKYDQARAIEKYHLDALARVVEFRLPLAVRAEKAAHVAVARANYGVLNTQAVFSHVRRAKLMGPALEHELTFTVSGGVTQAACDAANQALQEVADLERALLDYDASLRARGIDPTGGAA